MTTEISNKLLPIIFILIGLAMFVFGILSCIQLNKKLKNGIKTIGTIVSIKKERTKALQGADELSDIYYKYQIIFKDLEDKEVSDWSDFKTQTKFEIGSEIEVIYNKTNSEEFIIFPSSQKRLFIIFFIIGLVFIIIACVIGNVLEMLF